VRSLDKYQLIELLKELFNDGTIRFENIREKGQEKVMVEIEGERVQEFWL
jgi:hypothetical protein